MGVQHHDVAFRNVVGILLLNLKRTAGKKQIGKIAHIVAHSDSGPRADSSYPKEKRDTYENWILLCGIHHDLVDALDSDYTVTDLREMKRKHMRLG